MTTVDIPGLSKTGSNVEACYLDFDKARTTYADRLNPKVAADWATGGGYVTTAELAEATGTKAVA